MTTAHETAFGALGVTTPCCTSQTTLNDLVYDWPAGFARFVLEARNPGVAGLLSPADQAILEAALGCPVRQVLARI